MNACGYATLSAKNDVNMKSIGLTKPREYLADRLVLVALWIYGTWDAWRVTRRQGGIGG